MMKKLYYPTLACGKGILSGRLRMVVLALCCAMLCGEIHAAPKQLGDVTSPQSQDVRTVTVNGIVVDKADGSPIVGATVTIKQHEMLGGAISGGDGRFKLSVPAGSSIEVSCIGYITYVAKIDKDSQLTVVMTEDAKTIDDIVVVGYGVQRKESVVGAISQIETESLLNSGTTNITNAIAGKLSGVQTYQTSGQPGSNDATIVIRGLSSWNGSNPLVMVDGVERDFNSINPNEIKTISVLKDASATAVFGAKGANGVILVTTRTGNVGKAKTRITVETGVVSPTRLPNHISSYDTGVLANVAMKNSGQYGSLFSDNILAEYKNPSTRLNSVRYPDNDFYKILLNDFASNTSANYNVSGGTDKAKYFISLGYTHEGSLLKPVYRNYNDTDYSYDRFNYRSNIDIKLTKTTKLSFKVGGSTSIQRYPNTNGTTTQYLFTYLYKASPMMYPAYYPDWMLEEVPDPDHSDTGRRFATAASGLYKASSSNPYQYFGVGDFEEKSSSELFTDLKLDQNLDFIVKGLSFSAKASLTSSFYRISASGDSSNPNYRFNWSVYDSGTGNPWELLNGNASGEVLAIAPYNVKTDNTAKDQLIVFNWEASVNYDRKFGDHTVTALALFHQRDYNKNAAFPKRTQGFVARATYDFQHKYLFEVNLGYTGSEQFAPKYRYGLFPSAAIGYVLSQERFWREAMPWWSKFKIRYSDGLVGSDSAQANWLYYSSYTKTGGYIYEDKGANLEARWETARKRDLGVEMGWFGDRLNLSVDLFDEQRSGMLITPVATPLIGVSYKDVNRGSLKKHGMEIELSYNDNITKDLSYSIGVMVGLNESRVVDYEEALYTPEYQKQAGKPFDIQQSAGSYLNGMNTVDNGFLNSIDEIHGYPSYSSNWTSVYPGIYKLLDYTADGQFTTDDLHAIAGLTAPPMVYSFNLGFTYRGFSVNALFYGNMGKYVPQGKAYAKEFGKGDYLIREGQLDYWRPDHQNATHAALSFNDDTVYSWAGGAFNNYYTMMLEDFNWVKADYLTLKELYIGYRLNGRKLKRLLGIDAVEINLTGNNLWTLTPLVEGEPQYSSMAWNYYPVMASVKFGVKFNF